MLQCTPSTTVIKEKYRSSEKNQIEILKMIAVIIKFKKKTSVESLSRKIYQIKDRLSSLEDKVDVLELPKL
jgi:hypothetical protein